MFVRCFLLATIATTLPVSACDNMIVGDASRPDRASQRYVETLVGPVKARFAAVASASRCRQEDNRFSYEMLLSKLSGAGQAILEHAASEGIEEGRSVSLESTDATLDNGTCQMAVDRLRAADDRLLVLAETLRG